MADVPGPVQATVFVVPKVNTSVQYLTYDEARAIYGCGVSSTLTVAGRYADPTIVSCRNPAAGTQVMLARNLGLSEGVMIAPRCTSFINDATLLFPLISWGEETPSSDDDYAPRPAAIGEIDAYRAKVNPLAFQPVTQFCSFSVTTATWAAPPPRARSSTCIARSYETPSWASK